MTSAANLGDLIDRSKNPDKVAIVDLADAAKPLETTYGALAARIDSAARGFLARGLAPGDRVAILAANSTDYLVAFFGAMRAGLIAVPVGFKFPTATIHYILADCGAKCVVTDPERLADCPAGIERAVIGGAGPDRFDALLEPGAFDCVPTGPEDVGMILYTSGSTGRPKGVPLTHAGQIWVLNNIDPDGSALGQERVLVAAPLYHMNGLLLSKLVVATHACEVLLPQFRAGAYIEAIAHHRCTYLTSVPTMLALVARERELLAASDLTAVRVVMMGSAPLTQALIDRVKAIFPGAAVSNAYGTTEAGAGTFGAHPDGVPRPEIALGYPQPGVEARLVADDGSDTDEGILLLRTPATMTGYLNLPEMTRERLSQEGWYDTGDIMRRDRDGFFYFVGRADDMFVCGGENIYPGEVETMLERNPGIHQACVVPAADAVRGRKPVAFIVRAPGIAGAELTEEAVKDFALRNAPPHEHPRNVEFLSDLPLAGTNKIDRNALFERAKAYAEVEAG